jgi:hypothetical protein
VTPTLSLAAAESVSVPARPLARFAGALSVASGGCVSAVGALMLTVIAALLVVAPLLSVARAVRLRAPSVAGVHVAPYGGLVAVLPILTPFSKNSTPVMLPSLSAALAVSSIGTPVVPLLLLAGAVRAMLGGTLVTGPMSV